MFEIVARDGLARICRLEVRGKPLETPALLPVVNPKAGPIDPGRLKSEFGFRAIITNSFIINRDETLKARALGEGIHRAIGFDGAIMTDSGTFQEYTYGDTQVDPLAIVDFQRDIGSDIGTILDIFSEPDFSREKAADAVRVTIERARQSVPRRGEMWLSGPVQGSLFGDLRTECARGLSSLDLQLHPIGGVVPLMESYRFPELVNVIIASKKGLTPARPVHLFGAGHPMVFPLASLLGCDMFDSASYAKFARDGRMMFAEGTESLADIHELWCQCPVCSKHTADELRATPPGQREKLLAEHNLHVCQAQIRRTKAAIRSGTIWDLVERTCRGHPRLLDALHSLPRYNEYLEQFEPLSRKGAVMCTGSESFNRPSIWRYRRRFFDRYVHPPTEVMVGVPEARKPYSKTYARLLAGLNAHLIVISAVGPVPIELDEIYPVGQFFGPEAKDEAAQAEVKRMMERFSHSHRYGLAVMWDGEDTEEFIRSVATAPGAFDIDRARVIAVLRIQFGSDAASSTEGASLSYVKSRSTGRIRNVLVDGVHAFSIRAGDGYISLTDEGARLLHGSLPDPAYRVRIEADAIPFVQKGSNVFAKFVLDCDPEIRPGDDALIVGPEGNLVGHGRCLMNRHEMLAFKRGVAVRTRHHGSATEQDE